jgi:membrane protein
MVGSSATSKTRDFFKKTLWRSDAVSGGLLRRLGMKFLRLVSVAVSSVFEEQLIIRTMALVYSTLLSLIPLLAVSFALIKAFEFHLKMELFLTSIFAPLGQQGADLTGQIVQYVEDVDLSILGAIGVIFLLYKAVFLVYKIESDFNYIWRVSATKSLLTRVSTYVTILLLGPILIFAAIGIGISLMNISVLQRLRAFEPIGTIIIIAGEFIPLFFITAAFTFFYILLPDTRVRVGPALAGGVTAGIFWQAAGWIFATMTVSSAEYTAIYSGFAIAVIFLIWLYISWNIFLIGSRISFYVQHPEAFEIRAEETLKGVAVAQKLYLSIMVLIVERFYRDAQPWDSDSLSERLGYPADQVNAALADLESKGLIISSRSEPPAYFPRKRLEALFLKDVIAATGDGEGAPPALPEVENVINEIREAVARSLDNRTVLDIIAREERRALRRA